MKRTVMLCVLLAGFLSGLTMAQDLYEPPMGPPPGDECFMPGPHWLMGDELNLSQKQKEQIQELSLKFRKEQIQTRADLQVERIKLKELLLKNADDKSLEKQIDRIAKLQSELSRNKMQHRIEILKVLTKEQRKLMLLNSTLRPAHHGPRNKPPRMPGMKPGFRR